MFTLLIGRLYWLQIVNHDSLKTQALKQRGKEVNLCPDRGMIYDKNLIPLTNRERITTLFVLKDNIKNNQAIKSFIFKNSNLETEELEEKLKGNEKIIEIPLIGTIIDSNYNKEILISERILRYSRENLLSHVIGYINKSENIGQSGIEKVYDDILKNGGMECPYS